MNYIEALILGLIQGISEFLPVSSTAHLILAEKLFGLGFPGLVFELFLHFASVLAVVIYFFRDLIDLGKGFLKFLLEKKEEYYTEFKFGLFLILSTVVTGVFGLFLEEALEGWLRGKALISIGLIVSGILLYVVEKNKIKESHGKKKGKGQISLLDSIIIGVWQGLAVIPGISRSGATVVGALWQNLDKSSALSYSFFLAIPIILSSTLLKAAEIDSALTSMYPGQMITSFIATFFFALLSIRFLIYLIEKSRLTFFSLYLFVIAAVVVMI